MAFCELCISMNIFFFSYFPLYSYDSTIGFYTLFLHLINLYYKCICIKRIICMHPLNNGWVGPFSHHPFNSLREFSEPNKEAPSGGWSCLEVPIDLIFLQRHYEVHGWRLTGCPGLWKVILMVLLCPSSLGLQPPVVAVLLLIYVNTVSVTFTNYIFFQCLAKVQFCHLCHACWSTVSHFPVK